MVITTEQVLEIVKQLTMAAGQNQEANKGILERMEKNDKTVKEYILKIDEKMKADQARSSGENWRRNWRRKGRRKGRT